MFFSIDKDVLLENLNIVQKGLPVKTPNPILTGIKFEVYAKELIITTSNTDISIKAIINDSSLDVKTKGNIIIPGRFFIEIVRKITSKRIEISLIEDKIVTIKSERSEFKLNTMEYEYYPNIEFINHKTPLKIDAKILKNLIRETNFAAATSEKRPILTGVNFKFDDDKITCIATDSFRLSQKIVYLPTETTPFNIVIPNKSLDELTKALDNYNEELELFIENNKILFKFKNYLFQTRLLEGNYPDTSRLIPNEFPISIKFNKDELLLAIERVSLLSSRDRENNFNIIKFNLRKDHIVEITSTNNEIGDALEEIIPSDNVVGNSLKIAFSAKYLMDALRVFVSPEVTLCFTGEVKPFIIKGDLDNNLIHLVLPVKFD